MQISEVHVAKHGYMVTPKFKTIFQHCLGVYVNKFELLSSSNIV